MLKCFLCAFNTRYMDYIIKVIKLLQASDIKPIVVFDGHKLPAKGNVNSSHERYSLNNNLVN